MPGSTLIGPSFSEPGFFGKLPGLGDFVTRRLPQDFLRVWDPWLQRSLAQSRDALGEDWLDAYLTSPIWHFVLSDGIAGLHPWVGLLMPSVDRVGRYFPFTVARALAGPANPFLVLAASSSWRTQTQEIMLAALEGSLSLEEMDACLIGTEPEPAAAAAARPPAVHQDCNAQGWRLSLETPTRIAQIAPNLLHYAMGELFLGYSLWWSEGSERLSPSLLLCQGLPQESAFRALYTGDWPAGHWRDLGELDS